MEDAYAETTSRAGAVNILIDESVTPFKSGTDMALTYGFITEGPPR